MHQMCTVVYLHGDMSFFLFQVVSTHLIQNISLGFLKNENKTWILTPVQDNRWWSIVDNLVKIKEWDGCKKNFVLTCRYSENSIPIPSPVILAECKGPGGGTRQDMRYPVSVKPEISPSCPFQHLEHLQVHVWKGLKNHGRNSWRSGTSI